MALEGEHAAHRPRRSPRKRPPGGDQIHRGNNRNWRRRSRGTAHPALRVSLHAMYSEQGFGLLVRRGRHRDWCGGSAARRGRSGAGGRRESRESRGRRFGKREGSSCGCGDVGERDEARGATERKKGRRLVNEEFFVVVVSVHGGERRRGADRSSFIARRPPISQLGCTQPAARTRTLRAARPSDVHLSK